MATSAKHIEGRTRLPGRDGLVVDGKVGNDTWRRTLDYVVDVAIT